LIGWYVAKSKPQKEGWLARSLGDFDVEVYFPRVVNRKRGRDVFQALFPTYLFCRFDPERSDWPSIRWATGLSYFLGADGGPSVVSDELVGYIKGRVSQWNEGTHPDRSFKAGDNVVISNGPFAGLDGIFKKYVSSRMRCQILLQLVGRMTSVEIKENDLALTGGAL